ncbi:hypothetical protein Tco_1458626 [Tanacetum coccineum]
MFVICNDIYTQRESIQTALYAHGDEVEALHSQFLMSQYPELTNADRAGVVDRDSEQKIHDFVTIKIERSDSLLADCTKEHYFHIKKCNQLRQKEVKIRTLENHEEKETQRRRRKIEDPLLKDDKLEDIHAISDSGILKLSKNTEKKEKNLYSTLGVGVCCSGSVTNSSASGTHFLHKWENSKIMIQFTPSHT